MTTPLASGVAVGPSYYIPDLVVILADAVERTKLLLDPCDVVLSVEVISPASKATDVGLKRHEYAAAGIPEYWIVDRKQRRLTVLSLNEGQAEYAVTAEINAGTTYPHGPPVRTGAGSAAVLLIRCGQPRTVDNRASLSEAE